jgi:hypothetical protein
VLPAGDDKVVEEAGSDVEFVEAWKEDDAEEGSDWAFVDSLDPFIDVFLLLL